MAKKVAKKAKKEKVIEPVEEIQEIQEIQEEPKAKVLTPFQIKTTLHLAANIQLANKDAEIANLKVNEYKYQEQVMIKERQLIDKTIEIIRLRKELALEKNKEYANRLELQQDKYREHTDALGKEYDVDFAKCAFDPETGMIERVE